MIGIYGGTFNPIHTAHLRAAEEVCEGLGLDRMLFIPSARPPHKSDCGQHIASADLRFQWVQQALEGHPFFEADSIEKDRPGHSYLVDTLKALRERHDGQRLVFVVGQDAFSEMGTWRSPREIFSLVDVAVTTRPPKIEAALEAWLPACVHNDFDIDPLKQAATHRTSDTSIRLVPVTPLDISASRIRRAIRTGQSIRYLVPESIRQSILESGVYQTDSSREGDLVAD
ncbi:MAG: nicotinate (nicotinamide) nucleotide adenylyltransferase [bacterium TMED88]|nr:nicotinate (nicotinamide) nucleotide adenylyltransferase [Deltaproteobacteria bacterium]OUV30704.1 MAG: nicotinate (nicotinamide) nucleotide adenylyltransferase [bacterium TMED88]